MQGSTLEGKMLQHLSYRKHSVISILEFGEDETSIGTATKHGITKFGSSAAYLSFRCLAAHNLALL